MNMEGMIDKLLEQVSSQLFADLKRIYQAHAEEREPDKLVLRRAVEALVPFMQVEVERTKAMGAHPDFEYGHSPEFTTMLAGYEDGLVDLESALAKSDYTAMSLAVDQVLNLNHWYGSVWDELSIQAKWDSRGEVHDQLTAFMRSIGRFPQTATFKADEDYLQALRKARAGTWRLEPGPDGVQKRDRWPESEIEELLNELPEQDDIPIDMGVPERYDCTVFGRFLLDQLDYDWGPEMMKEAGVDIHSDEDLERFQDVLRNKLKQVRLL